jgi:ribose-phosphate pyrophosphokinase
MFRLCGKIFSRTAIAAAAVASIPVIHRPALAEASINRNHEKFEEIAIMPGSSGKVLAGQIASIIGCKNLDVKTRRFSDGETLVIINDTVRGRHVFIVQTCAAPMSDNIVELLQMVSAARGSGADRVTAIIPYFPYKFPRYASKSFNRNSRFL